MFINYMVLSYDFYHNISVGLFHDKKFCNCINLFPYIFEGFICNGFSISGGDLIKTTKSHMRCTCRKVKSQASYLESTIYQLANLRFGSPLVPVARVSHEFPLFC